MSKFRKGGKKDVPGVNTSALPDIVFMLLFFFMVATTMKEVDMLVEIEIPEGSSVTDITSLKQLNEVDFLYIGKPLEGGDKDVIQLDGELTISVLRVAKWKLEKVQINNFSTCKLFKTSVSSSCCGLFRYRFSCKP